MFRFSGDDSKSIILTLEYWRCECQLRDAVDNEIGTDVFNDVFSDRQKIVENPLGCTP